MIKVYIDTNIFKFSATELRRLVAKDVKPLQWGDLTIDSPVYEILVINPNDKIKSNEELKHEASLLQSIAELAKSNVIHLVIQHETLLESWGIPDMDSQSGRFYGAPYEIVEAPIEYSRSIFGSNFDSRKVNQYKFLRSINNNRFLEIQKATGAYQGERKSNENQIIDAWNIWCAEHNQCQFLLTMDFKLIRMIKANKKWESSVSLVTPSALLRAVNNK